MGMYLYNTEENMRVLNFADNGSSISAKVIADSIANGVRLTTMQLKFHRFILPEFNTHRMFSRSTSSSRAVPISKLLEQVDKDPAMPVYWGVNRPGMQANEEHRDVETGVAAFLWDIAATKARHSALEMMERGYHKQITNRVIEPYMWTNTIVSATEWDNFFMLRDHEAAQPEIRELARKMRKAMEESTPKELHTGEWHLPYVEKYDENGNPSYYDDISVAIKCSAARCARVSYLNHDQSKPDVEKDIELADKLISMGHMSPVEHQATPMVLGKTSYPTTWERGVTHMDRNLNFWSGNFKGWIQYRALVQ